ncbi:TPA: class I SAM-dependent methyltransferase [Serratia rubidaea]|uniref:class I SAM-dependent methyltransferase n=1 Tax=Serratia rubidaea TaxID=61652 RepID=UPI0023AE9415|nr:class I SAM-dependent methyltransferase [Serratia rubidaea]MDK1702415.1 class I SAM-dependent methyltransferase [Serratia rubidaea]HDJ1439499.1 class I SAM-dependent methyltransferase [Serratia rubidaea]HDJ1448184.1 class I SAM-dependent methyltransferase [Serratia rubidaea]HDJ1461880.1 class I SAM-dependent methyltransferase [Serratia rubidaea]HDJ2772626.1 class I SAM-dependent methyltransferase [Serratia rubidaea]
MDTTILFSDVATAYSTYRPAYPKAVFRVLQSLVPTPATATDIAAGTGIFSRGLQESGYNVTAVEPNAAMRAELVKTSSPAPFTVMAGTAEASGIAAHSTDLITIAQAFHWIDPEAARAEFQRIGTATCLTAVVWNSRNFTKSAFMRDYKALLDDFAPSYKSMKNHWSNLDERVKAFFPTRYDYHNAANVIPINENEMIGNLLSLSYAPAPATPEQERFIRQARNVFAKHQQDGKVLFDLTTHLYTGNLS